MTFAAWAALLLAAATPADDPPVAVLAGRVEVAGLGLRAADLVLHLRVANRTGAPLTLRDLAYDATIEGTPFRAGRVQGPVALPARGQVEIPIAATVGYGEAGGRILSLLGRGAVGYRVVGSVRAEGPGGGRVVRFDEAGKVGVSGVSSR